MYVLIRLFSVTKNSLGISLFSCVMFSFRLGSSFVLSSSFHPLVYTVAWPFLYILLGKDLDSEVKTLYLYPDITWVSSP